MQSTKREKILKTMTFQLNPISETEAIIKKEKLVEANKKVLNLANAYHPAYDEFIRELVQKSLPQAELDLQKLSILYEQKDTPEGRKEYNEERESSKELLLDVIRKNLPSVISDFSKIDSAEFVKNVLPTYIQKVTKDSLYAQELIDGINMNGLASLLSKYAVSRIASIRKAAERYLENFEIYLDNAKIFKVFEDNCEQAVELLSNYPEANAIKYEDYYCDNVTQEQIDAYNNFISGTFNEDGTIKTVGYNQFINEINQKNKSDKSYKGRRFKKLELLKKQILVPTEAKFTIDSIATDKEVIESVRKLDTLVTTKNCLEIAKLIKTVKNEEIAISGQNIRTLSHIVTGNYDTLYSCVVSVFEQEQEEVLKAAKTKREIHEAKALIAKSNIVVNDSVYSLETISDIYGEDVRPKFNLYVTEIVDNILNARRELFASKLLDSDWMIKGNEKHTTLIKNYLESFTDLRHLIKMITPKESPDDTIVFLNDLATLCDNLNFSARVENLVRNYITKKIGALTTKDIMTFGNPSFFENKWWSDGVKLSKNEYLLILKEKKIYLAIPSRDMKPTIITGDSDMYGVEFKNKAKAGQNLPRCLYTKEVTNAFLAGEEVAERTDKMTSPMYLTKDFYERVKGQKLYAAEAVTKGLVTEEERKEYLIQYIDILKDFMHKNEEWNIYNVDSLKDSSEYNNYAQFTDDVQAICLSQKKIPLDENKIISLAKDGLLYVFQVYARDLGLEKKNKYGPSQMLEYIVSDENFKNMTSRLTGGVQIYFQAASSAAKHIEHTKGSVLVNKRTKDGVPVPKDIYEQIFRYYNNAIKESDLSSEAKKWLPLIGHHIAETDIRKFNRFSYDKFYVTFSFEKNADVSGRNYINDEVNKALGENTFKKLVIIRNDTDLIYYHLYDESGKLLKEQSLNVIDGYDYAERLRETTRNKIEDKVDRWVYDNTTKELRNTYIQMAVGYLAKLAATENAIIIVEKVDDKTKRVKRGLDNQAYIGFEEALQLKLSDLFIKTYKSGEAGHVANPMQLTLSNTDAMKYSQNGIVYKIIPNYVSTMCPKTGYVNLFNFLDIKSLSDKRDFLKKFNRIYFNESARVLYFDFDYNNFELKDTNGKAKVIGKSDWTVQIGGRRIRRKEDKEQGYECVKNILDKLIILLKEENISAENCNLTGYINSVSNAVIDEMFFLFKCLSTHLIFNYKNEYLFISPVLGELELSPSEVTAINMYHKFDFDNKHEVKGINYTKEWLLYAQTNH